MKRVSVLTGNIYLEGVVMSVISEKLTSRYWAILNEEDIVKRLNRLAGLYSHVLWTLKAPWPKLEEKERKRILSLLRDIERDIDEIISLFDLSPTEEFLLREVILKQSRAFSFLKINFHDVVHTLHRIKKQDNYSSSDSEIFHELFDSRGSVRVRFLKRMLSKLQEKLGFNLGAPVSDSKVKSMGQYV